MFYLRLAILINVLVIFALITYMSTAFESDVNALEAFLEGDYIQADQALDKSRSHMSVAQYALNKAYLAREQRLLVASNAWLGLAKGAPEADLMFEVHLNEAFNHYLSGNTKGMEESLQNASKYEESSPEWMQFFLALSTSEDIPNAIPTQTLSPWWQKTMAMRFDRFWFTIAQLRSKMAHELYTSLREQAQEEIKQASPKQREELYLLLGLSYLHEADQKPLVAAISFDKLAFSYFNQIPVLKERPDILQKVIQRMQALINEHQFQELPFYAQILDRWHARTLLDPYVVLPLLGIAEEYQGLYPESYHTLTQFYHLFPMEHAYRQHYIAVLMQLQRYDLALEQLRLQPIEDKSPYVAILLASAKKGKPRQEDVNQLYVRRQAIQQRLVQYPTQLTGRLELAQVLHDFALAKHREDPSLSLKNSSDLRSAFEILKKLSTTETEIPHLYLLLGEVAWCLDDRPQAIVAFSKALQLETTSQEAYHKICALLEVTP